MLLTDKSTLNLTSIVDRASTLNERLHNYSVSDFDDKDKAQIEERLERWCQVVAKGNLAKFQQRLAWRGLDIETIRPFLVDEQKKEDRDLPLWAKTLEQVIHTAQKLSSQQRFSPQRYFILEDPVPFEPVYIPCLEVAQKRLAKLVGDRISLLTQEAQSILENNLVLQLNGICTLTLIEEFSAFRLSGNALQDFLLFRVIGKNRQEKYHAFIDKLFADGLLSLFEKYSVLGKLVAKAIDLWVETTAEFIDRLATDWLKIEQRFAEGKTLKQVVAIKPGLSDPHNGRRFVMALTFDTGMQLVYKPKDLSLDVAFYKLLRWCNSHTNFLPLKVLQVLNHDTHGWIEYVELLPCQDKVEAQRFYQRAGMLLCLIHCMGGTDCHHGNLIANGEQPVVIDTETLVHPLPQIERSQDSVVIDSDAPHLAQKQLKESVLKTLLLPQWGISPSDRLDVDFSGLGGVEGQEISSFKFKNINTDAMNVESEVSILTEANMPTIDGIALSPKDYLADLVVGFKQMYRFLLTHREDILAADSPLHSFVNQKARYVFRSTRIYFGILENSYQPNLLRYGVDRSIGLDVLSRAFLAEKEKPIYWELLDAELQSMEELDIPFFTSNSSEDFLSLANGTVIPEIFAEPSYDRVLWQIENLSETDLKQQIDIIYSSFYSRFAQEPNPVSPKSIDLPQGVLRNRVLESKTDLILPSEQIVTQAIAIAQELEQRAIGAVDGSMTWIGLGHRFNNQGFQLQSLGYSLSDGSAGVALFFASLFRVTKDSQWRELALRTLQPFDRLLHNSSDEDLARLSRNIGIGGATGLGSIVYALVKISQLLQQPELLKDAQKVASLITPESIDSDRNFNISEGVAGTILGLLALYRVENENPKYLDLAIACGEHLLKHQTNIDNSLQAWKTWQNKQLTGFSQGAAGIAYSLLQLFAVTQDSRFLESATAAIAYEHSVFNIEAQNWQDLRTEQPCFRVSWAQGAAGIGLGRLGSLSTLDTEAIRQEIAIATETTQRFALGDVDNLCWGNLGRLETLSIAAEKLELPELSEFVRKATTQIINQAISRDSFLLFSELEPLVYNPGFFHGTSGIGYQLLRIAYPSLLPSVLLWE